MGRITRDEAQRLVAELGSDEKVREHSEGVAHRAETVCEILEAAKHKIDTETVVIAALLHDIGRSRSHGLDQAKISAGILKEKGLNKLAEIIETHALPQTAELPLEVKVLIYADTTTGPDGEPIDPMIKLEFLRRLGEEWKNEKERLMAKEAYEVKRRIVSEIDALINQAMRST
jgi:putative nucleotidyltransferase with HDIG domain